jgi:HK97 family phage prohead protease
MKTTKGNEPERRIFAVTDLELRADGDTGAPTVEGYAAVFNTLSEPIFDWNGRYREKVAPGAFAKTIREQNIPLLVEHQDLPLATTHAKTLELREDAHGLFFRSVLDPTDPDVMRLLPKMRRGDMNKCSFAFVPIKEEVDVLTKPPTHTLREVKLFDVSIVSRPAYPATEAKARAALADDGLDAESIVDLLMRLRLGAPLDADDVVLMRRLADICQRHLPDYTTTAAEPEPVLDHSADAPQPVQPISAPPLLEHPLSWYRERLTKLEVTA